MTPPLAILLARLGEEVRRCADDACGLEAMVSAMVARGTPTPGEIEAAQALDALVQHLRAVAVILNGAAEGAPAHRLDLMIRGAGLGDLARRLLDGSAARPAAGELELW